MFNKNLFHIEFILHKAGSSTFAEKQTSHYKTLLEEASLLANRKSLARVTARNTSEIKDFSSSQQNRRSSLTQPKEENCLSRSVEVSVILNRNSAQTAMRYN